mgnify:CR=1 FL=1
MRATPLARTSSSLDLTSYQVGDPQGRRPAGSKSRRPAPPRDLSWLCYNYSMVDLRLQTDITQTLDLLLSPRLLQMLKILHLPYLELVEKITSEAEDNVMLEVERQD